VAVAGCDSAQAVKLAEMRALVIRPEPIQRILAGSKTWEIRRGRCLIRGLIGLVESGSGMVVGVAELNDCIGPLTLPLRIRNFRRMGITRAEAGARWPTDFYARVLRKRRRLTKPVPYTHPSGGIRWVALTPATEKAIKRQL
jgi:hypothetical protein